MSKLGINTGTIPNDTTGDSLLDGAVKVNTNFNELYSLLGDGNTLSVGVVTAITAGSGINVNSASGNVTVTNTGIAETANIKADTVTVSGIVTATSFSGTVPSSSLSGALPALDGSALTGVTGSGIVIKHDGSTVGTAGTINFSTNLDVTAIHSGIVTVTASGGSGITTENVVTDSLVVAGVSTFNGASNFNSAINVADNVVANFGASLDGRISYISSTDRFYVRTPGGTADLILGAGPAVRITNEDGLTDRAVFTASGATITGIVTASSFYGNFNGSITDATNLTGGRCDASTLNITGIATISSGRIQADASSNLRFGNVASGSGSGRNIAIGDQVLGSLSSGNGRNIGIGELSFNNTLSGSYNIGVGVRAGEKITSGQYNVVLGGYDGNSGNLDIRTSSNNVIIADGEGNIRQYIDSNGKVGINTTVITETLTVAGVVSATSFYGTVPSSQLTGALPSLDGSALTGVIATGSGVEIRDSDSPVGAAATINFGNNVSVVLSAGIATVSGASSVSTATTAYALAGSPDINVGVVTATRFVGSGISLTGITAYQVGALAGVASDTNPQLGGNLDVDGNNIIGIGSISLTGIITATQFVGGGANLTSLPAGQLTGIMPAIDGSALLNVNATGDGVVVENSGSNVGSAKTINFDTGLDVTYSSGIATVTASGGSLQNRTIVSTSTGSIADNAVGLVTVTGFKSYALMRVGLSTAGWIRIYIDSASRTADSSRSVGIDPAPGSGVIAEVVTTGISTQQNISPFTMGGNMDNPADTTIYASITNLSGTTQAITANLTILQLEA